MPAADFQPFHAIAATISAPRQFRCLFAAELPPLLMLSCAISIFH
jgi:hypothetical protein